MKNLDNYNVERKKVLLRVDLNVPVIDEIITEKSRIEIIKKTIKILQQQKNKIFLISHFGRPKGKQNKKYSLKFLCSILEFEFQVVKVEFLDNIDDFSIQKKMNNMQYGDICLFENIRFYQEEENNDSNFIKDICKNFDVFINDAFSVSHRNHASIVGPSKFLPCLAGPNLIEEIKNIDSFINQSKRPSLSI